MLSRQLRQLHDSLILQQLLIFIKLLFVVRLAVGVNWTLNIVNK